MFVIIVGCSPTGYQLAKLLLVQQHEVAILEKSASRCQMLLEEIGSIVIQGDGTDLVDLRRAGVTRADTVVAVTGQDETNLVVCQLVRHAFSVRRTVATIKDPKNQPIFRLLGVDAVVDISDLILDHLERSIVGSSYNYLAHLRSPGALLVSLTIPEDAGIIGSTLSQIRLRISQPAHGNYADEDAGEREDTIQPVLDRSFVSVVLRGDRHLQAEGNLALQANDEVIAVTCVDEEAALYEILTGV